MKTVYFYFIKIRKREIKRMKYTKFKIEIYFMNRILCLLAAEGIESTKVVLLLSTYFCYYHMEEFDIYISQAIN